jgi:hypothetical protein
MNHQEVLWVLQAGIDAVWTLGPLAALGVAAWRVARC